MLNQQILFIIATICCFLQVSCKKESVASTVTGKFKGTWRMVMVKQITTGVTTKNPAADQEQVEITFTATTDSTGTFSGKTAVNTINGAEYKANVNQTIQIPFLIMTKVEETPWGYLFVNNILNVMKYDFDGDGRLNINTPVKILSFQKI
jgi:hypothetical protein